MRISECMLASSVNENELNFMLQKLDWMQQENILLKNKVADILKNDIDNTMLERMEFFLNSFLNKDAIFALLRYDIAEYLKLHNQDKSDHLSKRTKNKLRQDLIKLEQEFRKLKEDFYEFIKQYLAY